MKNLLAKRILIAFIVLFLPFGYVAEGRISRLKMDTSPVTLTPEQNGEVVVAKPITDVKKQQVKEVKPKVAVNTSKPVQKVAVVQPKRQQTYRAPKRQVQQAVYKKPRYYNNSQAVQAREVKSVDIQEKNPKLEVLQFDGNYNVVGAKDTESYLIVPIDKTKLEKEKKQAKIDDITRSLMKDTPKPLTPQLKLKSKFHTSLGLKTHKLLSKVYYFKPFRMVAKISLILILLGFIIVGIYMIYQRRKIEEVFDDEEEFLTPAEQEHQDLMNAMVEFEKTEESHKKLEQKPYINEIETYKNLDGFKKNEVDEDILKTIKKIENAQKNDTPLTLKETTADGFKRQKYAFDEKIGFLSDEEGMALFEEEDDENYDEPSFDELSSNYYGLNSVNTFVKNDDEKIFIIEQDDEDDNYEIVEESNNSDDEVSTQADNNEDLEVLEDNPKEKLLDVENLHIIEKYAFSNTKGVALLDYHGLKALIGYIGTDITVLKKFAQDEKISGLSVRLYEEISPSEIQYIVRIGDFKGIIELNESAIRLVLTL